MCGLLAEIIDPTRITLTKWRGSCDSVKGSRSLQPDELENASSTELPDQNHEMLLFGQ